MTSQGLFFFVVQKHKATNVHYDFRLEIGKVMPSWAIPKGPTLDTTVKRLAMRTPDHATEYRNFEGILSEGTYGAGPVMIWDTGLYTPEVEVEKGVRKLITNKKQAEKVIKEELEKGELKFTLYGSKINGSFALIRTKGFGNPNKETWLLIKHKDAYFDPKFNIAKYDFSAITQRTMEQIALDPASKHFP
jgi:bifunctional non-homologous end joining protein LigD